MLKIALTVSLFVNKARMMIFTIDLNLDPPIFEVTRVGTIDKVPTQQVSLDFSHHWSRFDHAKRT